MISLPKNLEVIFWPKKKNWPAGAFPRFCPPFSLQTLHFGYLPNPWNLPKNTWKYLKIMISYLKIWKSLFWPKKKNWPAPAFPRLHPFGGEGGNRTWHPGSKPETRPLGQIRTDHGSILGFLVWTPKWGFRQVFGSIFSRLGQKVDYLGWKSFRRY